MVLTPVSAAARSVARDGRLEVVVKHDVPVVATCFLARSHTPAWERNCGRSSGRDPSSGQGFMTLEYQDLLLRWSVGARKPYFLPASRMGMPGFASSPQPNAIKLAASRLS